MILNNSPLKVTKALKTYTEKYEGYLIEKEAFESSILNVVYHNFNIYFDYFPVPRGHFQFTTRIRVSIKEVNPFQFKLSQKRNIFKGFSGIDTGDDVFDKNYKVQSKQNLTAIHFLNQSIKNKLSNINKPVLEITKNHPLGLNSPVGETCLILTFVEALVNTKKMNAAIDLVKASLDQLISLKITDDTPSDIAIKDLN